MNRFPARSRATLAAWIVLATGVSACSMDSTGGHDGTGLAVSFDGQWEGTWTSSSPSPSSLAPSGALTLQLEQTGTSVSGTGTFIGHPCLATSTVACQVTGHQVSGRFHAGSFEMSFSGSCPESNHCSGAHHANTLSASYHILDGSCAGESGSMLLTPVAAYGSDSPETRAVQLGEVILIDTVDGSVGRLPVFERPKAEH